MILKVKTLTIEVMLGILDVLKEEIRKDQEKVDEWRRKVDGTNVVLSDDGWAWLLDRVEGNRKEYRRLHLYVRTNHGQRLQDHKNRVAK